MRLANHFAIDDLAAAVNRTYHFGSRMIEIELEKGSIDIFLSKRKGKAPFEYSFEVRGEKRANILKRLENVLAELELSYVLSEYHAKAESIWYEDKSAGLIKAILQEFDNAILFKFSIVEVEMEPDVLSEYILEELQKLNPVVKNPRVRRPRFF